MIYRLGFATSRPQARQLVRHGHFSVNGKTVTIPSYIVSSGDEISVRQKSREMNLFKDIASAGVHVTPEWLQTDLATLTGKVLSVPTREQIDVNVQEHMIVEYYSK